MSAAFFAGIVVSPGLSMFEPSMTTSSSTSKSVLKSLTLSSSHLIKILLNIGSVCFLSATAARDWNSLIIRSLSIVNFILS